MCGGHSSAKVADADIQELVDQVRENVQNQLGRTFTTYEAVSYRSQVVAGTNFTVKVKTDTDYVHVRIFRPLPGRGDLEVSSVSGGHDEQTSLN